MRIVDTQVLDNDRSQCEAPYAIAVSSPCVLDLQRSLWGWRGLPIPGYRLPHNIVVQLYS